MRPTFFLQVKHLLRFLVFPSGVAGVSGRSSGAGEFLLLSSPVTEGPAADTPSTDTEAADSADDVVLDEEVVLVEMLEALASVLSDLGTVTVGLPVSSELVRKFLAAADRGLFLPAGSCGVGGLVACFRFRASL